MGRRKWSAPRRGSLAFAPRVRAKSIVPTIRSWVKVESKDVRILGFAGYKVGMTHVVTIENRPGTPMYGREVVRATTIIETPPLFVLGIRVYSKKLGSLIPFNEVWAENLPENLKRVLTLPEKHDDSGKLNEILSSIPEISEVRLIVCTQPHKAGIRKKTPEIFEIKVDGSTIEDQIKFALKLLGSEINVGDVFKEGQYVDVIAVTKGKGFQGVIKRFGIKELGRWHKHRKGSRKVGSIGPGTPSIVMWTVPRPGQMGFHRRTELNKRILKIGSSGDEINTKGGFKHYGLVKGPYLLIEGSVPGPPKRLIKIRYAIRIPFTKQQFTPPKIIYINR
ncbi:MAG: 50S ribosomal protein L3 [Candidatus Methanomethylicia archaeon]|nr:50S ribosomal protein L3 [Candidatus Methanomethylicia archaeon]MCX8169268.1 50S ribosomal protein L3 [Candidatus Methanomethylicia archaeon]MDW7988950.1 50S ribosomal protein L3 [Nitrososphaerota archaeon]